MFLFKNNIMNIHQIISCLSTRGGGWCLGAGFEGLFEPGVQQHLFQGHTLLRVHFETHPQQILAV